MLLLIDLKEAMITVSGVAMIKKEN